MELENLKEFVALSETHNYQNAADQLFISQASLSRHIKNMERELGARLFTRSTRKVELTILGAKFLPYAQKIIQIQNAYQKMIQEEQSIMKSMLNIGFFDKWTQYPIDTILAAFQEKNPETSIEQHVAESYKIQKELREERLDFAFIRESVRENQEDRLHRLNLYQDQLVAYVPISHPFAHREAVSVEEFQDEVFLLPKRGSNAYQLCQMACQEAGFQPHYSIEEFEFRDIFRFIERGAGIALLIASNGNMRNEKGVVGIPIKPQIHTYVNLVWYRDNLSAVQKEFVAFCSHFVKAEEGESYRKK